MSETQASDTGKANRDWFCDWVRQGAERAGEMLNPPEAAGKHFREARIEFLRGVRELIDHRIERLSRNASGKGTRVVVE